MASFFGYLRLGFLIIIIFYEILLPSYQKEREDKEGESKDFKLNVKKVEQKPNIFTRNTKLSIIALIIIEYVSFFILTFITIFLRNLLEPYYYNYDYYYDYHQDFSYLFRTVIIFVVPWIFLLFIWFYFVPKLLGFRNGRQSLSQYLDFYGLSWLKLILNKENIKTIIFVVSSISVSYIVTYTCITIVQDSSSMIYINYNLVNWGNIIFYLFFQELLYRGIILTILLKKSNPKKAIIQQAVIFLISRSFFSYLFIFAYNPFQQFIEVDQLIYSLVFQSIYIFVYGLLLGFAFYKRRSLLPGLISLCIISLFLSSSIFLTMSLMW
jgi:membrane protease YdiL (CAAX protease family)